jgi:hypothetical protein
MDHIGPCPTPGVQPPEVNGETDWIFPNLFRLDPSHIDRNGPWTVDRTDP